MKPKNIYIHKYVFLYKGIQLNVQVPQNNEMIYFQKVATYMKRCTF